MSKWTKETRDGYPSKYFGDPDNRLYPIKDQDDVDSAAHLIGKAPKDKQDEIKKNILRICKELELDPPDVWESAKMSLSFNELANALGEALGSDPDGDGDEDYPYVVDVMPADMTFIYSNDGLLYKQGYTLAGDDVSLVGTATQVQMDTTYTPVQVKLSFSTESEDGYIYEGEIFRAGNYADKGMNVTSAQIAKLAEKFTFSPLKIEHVDTPFDKALQRFGLVEVWAMGNALFGKVLFPKWLVDALGKEVKVSVGIARDASRILELSLVENPRVPTAKLVAAFSDFTSARHSKDDMNKFQAIHDHAMSLGAKCNPEMSGARHSKADMDDIQAIHDTAVKQGAVCPPADSDASDMTKAKRMTAIEKLRVFFGGDPNALAKADIELKDLDEAKVDNPQFSAELSAEITELKAENARNRRVQLSMEAVRFADEQIRTAKAVPAQKERLVQLYKAAVEADTGGAIVFSDSGEVVEGENLKALRELYKEMRPHKLFSQQIADPEVDPDGERGVKSEEIKKRVMESTALGRAALAASKNGEK